jgi:nanoRNase/pAp phosphatase (c-di-AMP/oligoRNAs hydrolase)
MVEEFKKRLLPASSALVVAHDYPDPDCLASACGVSHLLASWGVTNVVTTFGGFIGRAENRAMIRFLDINALPFPLVHVEDFSRVIIVDCVPGGGNVSLPPATKVDAVLDHHLETPNAAVDYYYDIRKTVGATSTIVTQYLLAAGLAVPPKLATALFYGIKTDTGDMGRDVSTDDLECYKTLFDLMDHRTLSMIEHPDRDIDYFRTMHKALDSALAYTEGVGFVHLGSVAAPDYIAEMADFFQSLEKLEWIVCSGFFKKNIFFSIRTRKKSEAGAHAGRIAAALGGTGGGHGKIGAGRVPCNSKTQLQILQEFTETMRLVLRIENAGTEKILAPKRAAQVGPAPVAALEQK